MSTFPGTLEEFPGVSIDRFDGTNLNSQIYFLSHCHTDHMVGLEDLQFQNKLQENNQFLYLSNVSAEICRRMFPGIAPQLKELDMSSPTLVAVDNQVISVTPIPAGHCPGSVMFLFEGQKTVLYTGDFRINPKDLPKLKAFYDSFNHLKTIDKICLDTTFFLKSYQKFPARSDSLEEICSIIKTWIEKSPKHIIKLITCAKYGYEYLFIEIYKKLKIPIHVNEEIHNLYSSVPEMDNAVTRSGQTQVHLACGVVYTDICKNSISYHIKTVKVSAWRWQNHNLRSGISEKLQYLSHNVCYSTHASYEEGAALIKFLKPKKVYPSVLHQKAADNEEIYKNIEEYLGESPNTCNEFKNKLFEIESDDETEEKTATIARSILDSLPRKKLFGTNSSEQEQSEENARIISCILDSPPRKKMK